MERNRSIKLWLDQLKTKTLIRSFSLWTGLRWAFLCFRELFCWCLMLCKVSKKIAYKMLLYKRIRITVSLHLVWCSRTRKWKKENGYRALDKNRSLDYGLCKFINNLNLRASLTTKPMKSMIHYDIALNCQLL